MTMVDQLSTTLGIYDEARKLLDYAVASAESIFVELPKKRYVTVGQAVHDCEQVVFEMTNLQTGLPADTTPGGQAIKACPPPWSLVGTLSIVRCGPVMTNSGTVSSTVLEAFAKTQAVDALILQSAVTERVSEMFGAVVASITWPPPTGAFVVTSARITAAVST
jgi:hypothetical protein